MIHFDSPTLLAVSLALVVATTATVALRRMSLRRVTRALLGAGLVLLALAAGGATIDLSRAGRVAVLVDVSPSTRTAEYRGQRFLEARVAQLLGGVPPEVREYSPDVDTTLPAGFDAILLLSDGRFAAPPVAPPTYAVIDPALSATRDARVDRMELRHTSVAVSVVNDGDPRELSLNGASQTVGSSQVVAQPIASADGPIAARLSPGDAWPENDALSVYASPTEQLQRWWVGASAPSSQWVSVDPSSLPVDPAAYLDVALIVLDNVPADALSAGQQERLLQYVRDVGGGVIILGGARAFAAGGYPGTALEAISPLSSTPPPPTTHWVLLADSSGSMAAPAGGTTRFRMAADAVARVLPRLPPDDPVSAGSFARELRWWSRGTSARALSRITPPSDVAPHGPTNLQAALDAIVSGADGSSPTEVLLLSDADTKLDAPALAASMRSKRVRLHLLATAEIGPDNPVKKLVEVTGGTMLAQADPQRWAASLRDLLRAASPARLREEPLEVRFVGPLSILPSRNAQPSNQVWEKERITALATATSNDGSLTLGALWNLGAGRAAAVGFEPRGEEVEAIAALVASPPRDPRFTVTWDAARVVRVTVDAVDGGRFMNGLDVVLQWIDPSGVAEQFESRPIPQVGPGRYEIELPASRTPRLASVRLGDRIIAQRAIAGRYAPEFDAIGTDRAALRALAERTGGRVIEPTDTSPIQFTWPRRRVNLSSILAATGALLVAAGLVHGKLG